MHIQQCQGTEVVWAHYSRGVTIDKIHYSWVQLCQKLINNQ